MRRTGTPKALFFPQPPKEEVKPDGEPAVKKNKKTDSIRSNFSCQECSVLKCSLSKLQNDPNLKIVECNDLHSRLDLQKESFQKKIKSALEKISDLEKQLHHFEQKHGDLQEELLFTKRTKSTYQKKFSNKCAALSKAHKKFEDVKTEKQVNDNDVIHVTKCDDNFPKRIFFGKLHYGLSSGKKLSQGKNCVYARISFNKKVTAVTKKMQGERANILKAILGYMANGEQGDELLLALLIKSYPHEIAKKSIEGAGFSLLRNVEVHKAIQFRSILHLPMNT